MVEIGSVRAKILPTLSLCGGGGGGGLKSFLCHTQLLNWVEVELGLWQKSKNLEWPKKANKIRLGLVSIFYRHKVLGYCPTPLLGLWLGANFTFAKNNKNKNKKIYHLSLLRRNGTMGMKNGTQK